MMKARSVATLSRLQILEAEEAKEPAVLPATAPAPTSSSEGVLLDAILLGLRIISTRTVALFGHLIPLLAIGSGFALWWSVKESPSIEQLIGLGLYALFMLAILVVRGK